MWTRPPCRGGAEPDAAEIAEQSEARGRTLDALPPRVAERRALARETRQVGFPSPGPGVAGTGIAEVGVSGSGAEGPWPGAPPGSVTWIPEQLAPFGRVVPGQLLAEAPARAKGTRSRTPPGLGKVTQTDA